MIHYNQYGRGQSVILLHSGGMAGEEWQPQIPLLAGRYQVFVPDLLGHGQSPLAAGEKLTIAGMARAVLTMMDAENLPAANFCGSSLGGAVALWLALHHPERVKRLALYRMTYHTHAALHAETLRMADPAYWEQFRLSKWLSALHEPQGGSDAWRTVIARVNDALDPLTSDHCHDLTALQQITCPVLLIAGDRDPIAPLEDLFAMLRTFPDAGLCLFPFADHITGSNTWRAGAFGEELRRFFGREKKS